MQLRLIPLECTRVDCLIKHTDFDRSECFKWLWAPVLSQVNGCTSAEITGLLVIFESMRGFTRAVCACLLSILKHGRGKIKVRGRYIYAKRMKQLCVHMM